MEIKTSYLATIFQYILKIINKSRLQMLILGFVIACTVIILYIDNYDRISSIKSMLNTTNSNNISIDLIPVTLNNSTSNESKPIILYWEPHFQDNYYHFIPNENTSIQCPYDCMHTANRIYGANASVRIFNHRRFNFSDIPPNNPNALNVYFTLEPPHLTFSRYSEASVPRDYFNLTGSYRTSSEIYYPYDYFIKRDGTETEDQVWTEEQIDQKIAEKSRTALIAMSNCKAESKRHEYVKALDKYMKITKLDEHYFYLSFENSVCPEYVTEKFWRLKQLIVPIVLSRAVMPLHIPSNAYIAASDFESPQALSDYLQYLMQNITEYKKFFEWTRTYRKTRVTEEEIMVSCQLCKLAYRKKSYTMKNYKEYWSNKECVKNYALNLLTNQPNDLNNVVGYEQKLTDLMKNTYRPRSIGNIL